MLHGSVGYWVWALSVILPGCASGTSQRELDPRPLESQGPQIREYKALWVKPASGPSLPSLKHQKQLCLATSRKRDGSKGKSSCHSKASVFPWNFLCRPGEGCYPLRSRFILDLLCPPGSLSDPYETLRTISG